MRFFDVVLATCVKFKGLRNFFVVQVSTVDVEICSGLWDKTHPTISDVLDTTTFNFVLKISCATSSLVTINHVCLKIDF